MRLSVFWAMSHMYKDAAWTEPFHMTLWNPNPEEVAWELRPMASLLIPLPRHRHHLDAITMSTLSLVCAHLKLLSLQAVDLQDWQER